MITLIVGHRGTGKTALLERIQVYAQEQGQKVITYDLDQEIEKSVGLSVEQIFATQGEEIFREVELEILNCLLAELPAEHSAWIALGAGFQAQLPRSPRVLWLRRPTDTVGRIFLNRPPLNKKLSPLEDYFSRYQAREGRYREWSDFEYTQVEGFNHPSKWEAAILGFIHPEITTGGVVTLLPDYLKNPFAFSTILKRLLSFKPEKIELRDDLLSESQLMDLVEYLSPHQTLYSLRRNHQPYPDWRQATIDWALELPDTPTFDPQILSRHERTVDLDKTLAALPQQSGAILKLAVEIDDFNELRKGHEWWLQDPTRRSFLPRSKDGRWQWYRQLFSRRRPLSFWREGIGSASDQPTLADWLRMPTTWSEFAAVLGSPVIHSHTPFEQQDFFAASNMPVIAVDMAKSEMTLENLNFLNELGLTAAAVTSPLKEAALDLVQNLSPEAKSLAAVNTLAWNKKEKSWQGHNTDLEGFKSLIKSIDFNPKQAVVWGGGGTRAVMEQVLPQTPICSVRAAEVLKTKTQAASLAPQTVIWAVGRKNFKNEFFPPESWQPKLVIDLNYSEDSPGREYALKCRAQYINGEKMFKVQAEAQRRYWQ